MPVDSTVKAKTLATTTNAMRMIAVSSPVMPRSERSKVPLLSMCNVGVLLCVETAQSNGDVYITVTGGISVTASSHILNGP